MQDVLHAEKRKYAAKDNVDIAKVPTYKVRTPLQKAIQLLKRHRDILFEKDDIDAPISIIITTLAALAYDGESNVYEALCNIIRKMPQFIEKRDGRYWIANPVMREENFADKWNEDPNKVSAFTHWLRKANKDLIMDPLGCFGQDNLAKQYKQVLGKAPVERALTALGHNMRLDRQNGNLYMNGLTGGFTTTPSATSKPVKDHIFYGE